MIADLGASAPWPGVHEASVKLRDVPSDLLFIFVAFAATGFATGVIAPLLAEIRSEFAVSFTALGLLISMQSLAPMVVHLLAGYAADRFAPRLLITTGGLLLAAGMSAAALAPNFGALMAAVLLAGLGSSLMMTSCLAYTVRRADARQRGRATTRVMTGQQVGAFLGPFVGGLVASVWDWRAALVLAAAIALAVSLPGWWLVTAPFRPGSDRPVRRLSLSAFRLTRPVLGVVALSMLITGPIIGQRNVVLPLYGSTGLDLDPAAVGLIVSLVNGVRAVLGLLGGNLMDRAGRGAALLVMVVSALAAALLLLPPSGLGVYILLGSFFALSGVGAFLPSVLIGDRAPPDRVGVSLGVLLSLGAAVAMGAVTGIGYLLDVSGFGTVGLAMTVLLVAAGALGLRVVGGWRPPGPGAATPP